MIKFFSDISVTDTITCGGKWASLWEMTQAGFPVPEGFVLTTEAFWCPTKERENEVLTAFDQLNTKFVAVRSSGTKEDGEMDSFAGQFETYLFVKKENLVDRILKCHHSINSERIVSYCESKNINRKEIKVAVVIQKMINSDAAGVCFTANPISGSEDELMIEAWYGVGEAVVSWMITPDKYIVNKKTGEVQKSISTQTIKLTLNLEIWWIKEASVYSDETNLQKLSDEQIKELSKYAQQIEKHYWKPMDIEWALENNKIYILQARPITTLASTASSWLEIVKEFIRLNEPYTLYPPIANVSPFLWTDWGTSHRYDKYYHDRTPQHAITIINKERSFWGCNEDKLITISKEMFYRSFEENNLIDDADKLISDAIDKMNAWYAEFSYEKINTLKEDKISWILFDIQELLWNVNGALQFTSIFDKKIAKEVLEKLGKYPWDASFEEAWEVWISAFNFSFEMDWALYLAQQNFDTQDHDTIVKAAQFLLASYMSVPDLKETSIYVNTHLSFLFSKQATREFMENALQEYEIKKESYLWKVNKIWNKDMVHFANYIQSIITIRDKRKNFFNKGFVVMWRCAEKLFSDINLDKKYIKYILISELIKGKEYLSSIRENIENRDNWFVIFTKYDWTIQYWLCNFEQCVQYIENKYYHKDHDDTKKIIYWDCGNKWFITGYVQIIKDKSHFDQFKAGNILVTGMTRPEYVPLMKIASAIITDEWGITCHAAIVSREMGKPCIIWTRFGTKMLKDGDFIKVDADSGTITIIESTN